MDYGGALPLFLRHEWLKRLQQWLKSEGYSRVSVRFYLACLHRLADWLYEQNLDPIRLADPEVVELYFAQHTTVRGRALGETSIFYSGGHICLASLCAANGAAVPAPAQVARGA